MKLSINWKALAWAVAKAVWPFIAGAVSGGLVSGCSMFGPVVGKTAVM